MNKNAMGWKRSMAQMLKCYTVSSVTLYTPHSPAPPQCICSPNVVSVAANNQKRQIVTGVFLHSESPHCFLCETAETKKNRWMDGEKPQHINTPQALMETCRLLGDRSTHGLGLPWKPGYMAGWTDTGVFAFTEVWTLTDRFVSMLKREETFPTCIIHCFYDAKHATSMSTETVSRREKYQGGKCLKRHGCVTVCKRK